MARNFSTKPEATWLAGVTGTLPSGDLFYGLSSEQRKQRSVVAALLADLWPFDRRVIEYVFWECDGSLPTLRKKLVSVAVSLRVAVGSCFPSRCARRCWTRRDVFGKIIRPFLVHPLVGQETA